jgi:hypothetical protein
MENGGRLFRRPKLTLNSSTEVKEGRNLTFIRFEALTAVIMKNSVLWDITSCILLKVNRSFERISQAGNHGEAGSKQGHCQWTTRSFIPGDRALNNI